MDEIAPGIWRWTAPHPEWRPEVEWGREVALETKSVLVPHGPPVVEGGREALAAGPWDYRG